MTYFARHFIRCDHPLCVVEVEGASKVDAGDEAGRRGWERRRRGRSHAIAHYCPEHRKEG